MYLLINKIKNYTWIKMNYVDVKNIIQFKSVLLKIEKNIIIITLYKYYTKSLLLRINTKQMICYLFLPNTQSKIAAKLNKAAKNRGSHA